MEKQINERYITFSPKSARLPYPEDMELGQEVLVMVGPHDFLYNVVKVEFFDKPRRTHECELHP